MKKRAADLVPGDLVDLEDDPFAPDHPSIPYELAMVATVEQETPECVAVGFEGIDVIGFPTNHLMEVQPQ